jgi:hypothetical protein
VSEREQWNLQTMNCELRLVNYPIVYAGFNLGECGGEFDWLKYDACEGEAKDPGKNNGTVGISSNTC